MRKTRGNNTYCMIKLYFLEENIIHAKINTISQQNSHTHARVPFFLDGSKHSPMAALSSSLDSGVNSVSILQSVEVRGSEVKVSVLEGEVPIPGYWVKGRRLRVRVGVRTTAVGLNLSRDLGSDIEG